MPYTVIHLDPHRPGSDFAPETVVVPQIVVRQVPHYVSPDSAKSQTVIRKLRAMNTESQPIVDTLRVLGRYDLHTSTYIHQRDCGALRRNEIVGLPGVPCERHEHLKPKPSSLEVEIESYSHLPEISTLEELQAKQRKTCM